MCGLLIMSYDEGIIVQESFFAYKWHIVLAIIFSFFVCSFLARVNSLTPLKTFAVGLATFIFTIALFENSFPLYLHKLSNKEKTTILVEVQRISIPFAKGEIFKVRCKGKTVKAYGYYGRICGIPKGTIDGLYEGNKLILTGEKSRFGFIAYQASVKDETK